MTIRYDHRVAIVTGAGAGLGREYALALAARGAQVLVNDYAQPPAEETVALIRQAGGDAHAFAADVADEAQVKAMLDEVVDRWGRADILVNNAGILRDKSFAKMTLSDWDAVVRVHLTGSAVCTMAVWPLMRDAGYGRIVFTSSSSGLYGNYGQANYGAAKAAMIGLMNVLHVEGGRFGIRVNTIAPAAATAMTKDLLPPAIIALMDPKAVVPGLLYLVSEDAPSRAILSATAGGFSRTIIAETRGVHLAGEKLSPEGVRAAWDRISDIADIRVLTDVEQQLRNFVGAAAAAAGASFD